MLPFAAIRIRPISILLKAIAFSGEISMQRHLSCYRGQILIADKLLLLLIDPTRLRQFICSLHRHNVSIRLKRLNFDTNTIDFAFDHIELILLATLVVDNNRRIITNVFFLRIDVVGIQWHHGRYVVDNLDDAIEPKQSEFTRTAVRLQATGIVAVGVQILQADQIPQAIDEVLVS